MVCVSTGSAARASFTPATASSIRPSRTNASEARSYGNDEYPLEPLFAAMAAFHFEGVPTPLGYARWLK